MPNAASAEVKGLEIAKIEREVRARMLIAYLICMPSLLIFSLITQHLNELDMFYSVNSSES